MMSELYILFSTGNSSIFSKSFPFHNFFH
jgi:hypothetical protein